ncbi:helix-turn-helix domain-containing protein [Streptomyces lavendofoliae]|uniref:XRE family transcriptional regulator n=1 Tax=Streptomyces lavendofoliae TaxID=67314 RepID=A0A918HY35_9ACTN|nr:helix-turn-helix domain-containing protein [Streptomyces lavendofoliae]GGU44366.1 hypothetical protein GCM10010274_35600 [Streptomyces lavendofoliae]
MADGEQAPDPRGARDPAEFVERLQALKDWSGLTYRELAARAEAVGDVLPRSTVANMLARPSVPREELLRAFVRACGAGPEVLEVWLAVREELASRGNHGGTDGGRALSWPGAAGGDEAGDASTRGDGGGAGPGAGASRWQRLVVPVTAVLTLVVAVLTVVAFLRGDGEPAHRPPDAGATAPSAGPVHVRAVHSGLCLNERRGQESGQVYQVPCAGAVVPRYSLVPLDGGLWTLRSDHPDFGAGCAGIPAETARRDGAPLVDQECGRRGPGEAFRIEPVTGPHEGYRVRSAHSGLCLEVREGSSEPWADVVQRVCDDTGAGQVFSFDRRTAA